MGLRLGFPRVRVVCSQRGAESSSEREREIQ